MANGELFALNLERYTALFLKADLKPNYKGDSLNKCLMRRQDILKTNDQEINDLRERVKQLWTKIYGKENDDGYKNCGLTLRLKSYPEATKYREAFRKMQDFIKCEPFIYQILDGDPDLRQLVYGSSQTKGFRFDPFFIQSLQGLIQFKQNWLKRTEQVKQSDNNCFFEIVGGTVDFFCETPRSLYATGMGPLSTPYQE